MPSPSSSASWCQEGITTNGADVIARGLEVDCQLCEADWTSNLRAAEPEGHQGLLWWCYRR